MEANPEWALKNRRRRDKIAHEAVLAHYSPVSPPGCACCGVTENLSLDHADGDGADHREDLFGNARRTSRQLWRWLIEQGFPPGYQVLCIPCNSSKGRGEHCTLRHCTREDDRVSLPRDRNHYYQDDRGDKSADYQRARDRYYLGKVLAHYSPDSPPCCACCSSGEGLSIDHVNGNGKDHHESTGKRGFGTPFWRWLIEQGFPPGYQVLCKSCNSSKGRGKRCRLTH
jgi:hypothetical protein